MQDLNEDHSLGDDGYFLPGEQENAQEHDEERMIISQVLASIVERLDDLEERLSKIKISSVDVAAAKRFAREVMIRTGRLGADEFGEKLGAFGQKLSNLEGKFEDIDNDVYRQLKEFEDKLSFQDEIIEKILLLAGVEGGLLVLWWMSTIISKGRRKKKPVGKAAA